MASTEDLLKKQYGTLLSIDRHIDQKNTTVLLTDPISGYTVIGLVSFVSGVPVTKYYNTNGTVYNGEEPIPVSNSARRYISSEKISVSATAALLTIPGSIANYAEIHVNTVECIWGLGDSIVYPCIAQAKSIIKLESASELEQFEIRALSNTTVTVNYFIK
jgi:hypothetical protein